MQKRNAEADPQRAKVDRFCLASAFVAALVIALSTALLVQVVSLDRLSEQKLTANTIAAHAAVRIENRLAATVAATRALGHWILHDPGARNLQEANWFGLPPDVVCLELVTPDGRNQHTCRDGISASEFASFDRGVPDEPVFRIIPNSTSAVSHISAAIPVDDGIGDRSVVSVVHLDTDRFFDACRLTEVIKNGFVLGVHRRDINETVFAVPRYDETVRPVTIGITVPGIDWVVGVAPEGGWHTPGFWTALLALVTGLAGGAGTFHLAHRRLAMASAALHDPLTHLPNRRLLRERTGIALAQAERNRHTVALLFIDLDGFKPVNDELGHDAGDAVLCSVAKRLNASLRSSDTVARIGGDEFVVVLGGLADGSIARKVAEELVELVSRPIHLDSRTVQVHASIGIARYPEDGRNLETLLRAADVAMYRAKRAAGGRYEFFSPCTPLTESGN